MMLLDPHVITVSLEKVKPFIVTEKPAPGESLLGFISRNLSQTATRRLGPGLALAGIGTLRPESLPRTLEDPRQVASLAKLFNTTADEIEARLYRTTALAGSNTVAISFNQVRIRAGFREGRIRRVSPIALRSSAVHRSLWELRPFTFDPETLEHLLDTCPVCSRKLNWIRASEPQMCNHCLDEDLRPIIDLRDFPQSLVEADDVEALTLAPRLLSHVPSVRSDARASISAPWCDLSESELFETIMSISFSLSHDHAHRMGVEWRRKSTELGSLSPMTLCRVSRSILDGGKAFDALLEELRSGRATRKGHYGQFVEFGQMGGVRKNPHMSSAAKAMVYDAISRVLASRPMERRFRGPQQRSEDSVDFVEASLIAGISRQCIKKMASAQLLEVKRGGHRGLTRCVKPTDVLAIAAELNATIPDFEVERQLGIDRLHFSFLESAGLLIRPRVKLRPLLPAGTNYTAASIEALLARLRYPLENDGKAVPINEAVLTLCMDPLPWSAILTVIATKPGYGMKLAEASSDWRTDIFVPDIARFKLEVAEVIDDLPPTTRVVTAVGAAEILGTTVNFVGRAVKRGALGKLPGRPARFDQQSIISFRAQYIYGSELARHFGVSNTNTVHRRLTVRGILPAFSCVGRDLIYAREGLPGVLN